MCDITYAYNFSYNSVSSTEAAASALQNKNFIRLGVTLCFILLLSRIVFAVFILSYNHFIYLNALCKLWPNMSKHLAKEYLHFSYRLQVVENFEIQEEVCKYMIK